MAQEKVIELTIKQIIRNALKYLDKGKLQVQAAYGGDCEYYAKGGYKCVIGASLSKADGMRLDQYVVTDIKTLMNNDLIIIDNNTIAEDLQDYHDALYRNRNYSKKRKTSMMRNKLNKLAQRYK